MKNTLGINGVQHVHGSQIRQKHDKQLNHKMKGHRTRPKRRSKRCLILLNLQHATQKPTPTVPAKQAEPAHTGVTPAEPAAPAITNSNNSDRSNHHQYQKETFHKIDCGTTPNHDRTHHANNNQENMFNWHHYRNNIKICKTPSRWLLQNQRVLLPWAHDFLRKHRLPQRF